MKKHYIFIMILSLLVIGFYGDAYAITKGGDPENPKRALEVSNSQGERIGNITQGIGDQQGNVILVVLSLEEQEREIVVPITAFSMEGNGKIILDIDKQILRSAPEFRPSELNDANYIGKIFSYYAQNLEK